MKRFPELARRGVALALAASMSLSVFMPGALAADLTTAEEHDHDHVHLAAENSVDALGNEDFSDETYNVPGDTADAADHTWGEWTEGETEDGQPVKLRICEDCGAVELEDGTIIGYINMGDEPELADDDQPEWYPSDFIAPLGMDDSDYALTTQGLNADGETWNYSADHSKWVYNTSTQYPHGTNDMGNDHHSLPIQTWTSTSNGKNKAVTCKEEGYIGHTCNISQKIAFITIVCHSEWRETIPTPGSHLKNLYEVKATCTEPGVKYYYCGRNNGVNGGNGGICYYIWDNPAPVITPATGHHTGGEDNAHKWTKGDGSNVGWVEEPATCTTPGKRYRKCDTEGCGFVEEDEDYAKAHPATGHKTGNATWAKGDNSNVGWGKVNQPYPCKPGTKTRECDICHEKEIVTVPATKKHKYEFASTTQEHPCTAGKETWKCSVCGETEERDAKVAEHSYGAWFDDYEYGCQNQNQSHICLVCRYKETKEISEPARKHKYTHYTMSTPDRWVAVDVPIPSWISDWALNQLPPWVIEKANINVKNRTFTVKDTMPTPVVRADCEFGCSEYDELNAVTYPKYAAQALAATQASESVAKTADPLIREALDDTKTAVNNAKNREEAIAALDQIYEVAKKKLVDQGEIPVTIDITIKGEYPELLKKWLHLSDSWSVPLYQGTITVPITEEIADAALSQLKAAIEDAKNMLSSSFLSEDAIKVAINKIVDTVANDGGLTESIRQLAFYPIYESIGKSLGGGRGEGWNNQPTDSTPTETGELILRLAESAVTDKEGWQPFLDAIFDNLIDMLIEQLKKDPEYSKYLNNALGDELLEELRPKLREELVNDTTFVDTIRNIAGDAIHNAAYGVKRGWSDARVLAQLREDLMKVQDPVEQEMLDLSATIGDLVESSLAEKINKLLPFGDLTSWIGKWVGAFAKDKAVSEVVGETGKVRQTIEMYIKYITCGKHRHVTENIAATCTEPAYTIDSCSKCGWRFSKEKTGEPLGHDPVTVPGVEPTETADGLTDGVQCARCGAWLEPQEVIPAQEPQYEKYLVKSAVTADTVKAAGYKNQKKLDEAIDAALTKAGYQTANSERFLAQVQTSIGILSNDRYPEDGVTGMVKLPAGAAGKNCTFYAVQVLTADTHGYSAGDVVITPLTVTSEGISFKLPVQSVVAIAWKVNE